MGLEDLTDGAEENHKKDRAEQLGLESIDGLENLESLQERIKTHRSLIVSQDKEIEYLEKKADTLEVLLLQVIKDNGKQSESTHTARVGEADDQSDQKVQDGEDDDGGSSGDWSIDL